MRRSLNQDEIYLFNTGNAQAAYLLLGCHFLPEAQCHRFVVWAPHARAMSLVGDFNSWDKSATPMKQEKNGLWSAYVKGLKNGDLYKYCIWQYGGGTVLKADPFAFHSETGPGTASKVWDIEGYAWGDESYLAGRTQKKPQQEPMSIYEVHLGSWRWRVEKERYPWYRKIADQLALYCQEMGYTHVELLPVTEYPFDGSWGYQVTGYFAPTSRYGTPQDFMYFIDTLHQAGIGVIMDWAPAHFPRDEHGLRRFDGTALFEHENPIQAEHPEWGTLIFNYGRPEVQSFLISSAMHFFDQYHIDGLRVDAVSSMLYLDYGRNPGHFVPNKNGGNISLEAMEFLRKLNEAVLTRYPGCFTMAEESTAYPLVTRPPYDDGLGFTFKWDMGFMHDMLEYLAMDPYFRHNHHDKLTFSMMYAFSEHFVLAFSHDEVVHGKKSLLDKMYGDYEEKFATLRTLFGYQFAHPGKKLHFMGSEFGQFIEWDYQKELDWLLLGYPQHAALQRWVAAMNRFYHIYACAVAVSTTAGTDFRWLSVDERE